MSLEIVSIRYPAYVLDSFAWQEWRDTYCSGRDYLRKYLTKFSDRETDTEFQVRENNTPIPSFAKSAILDVRNSIFQRLEDVSRIGGSAAYQKAAAGENGGVDRKGSNMNAFIGKDVLTELLVMGRCGIYVDAPARSVYTMADEVPTPYVYYYPVEDILSWTYQRPDEPGQFKAVLLRDQVVDYHFDNLGIELPKGRSTRYRLLWISDVDGYVYYRLLNEQGDTIYTPGNDALDGSVRLDLKEIPFIMPDIGDSLLKDVSSYQRALLNIISGDVNYALKSNTPFLTIQDNIRAQGGHLKDVNQNTNKEEFTGSGVGRIYAPLMDRPEYIHPSPEPLLASMKLRDELRDEIRALINLAVENKVGSRTESAESKKMSSQGLEAGLSFIGLVLQKTETLIAKYWASYENVSKPMVATVSYPSRYILKTDKERIEDATKLYELMQTLPGEDGKKEGTKAIWSTLLTGKIGAEKLAKILRQVDSAKFVTSDSEDILAAHAVGLVSDETASEALGYAKGEVEQAKKDRAERIALTIEAQTPRDASGNPVAPAGPAGPGGLKNPASRGAPELDTNPDSGKEEQKPKEGDI